MTTRFGYPTVREHGIDWPVFYDYSKPALSPLEFLYQCKPHLRPSATDDSNPLPAPNDDLPHESPDLADLASDMDNLQIGSTPHPNRIPSNSNFNSNRLHSISNTFHTSHTSQTFQQNQQQPQRRPTPQRLQRLQYSQDRARPVRPGRPLRPESPMRAQARRPSSNKISLVGIDADSSDSELSDGSNGSQSSSNSSANIANNSNNPNNPNNQSYRNNTFAQGYTRATPNNSNIARNSGSPRGTPLRSHASNKSSKSNRSNRSNNSNIRSNLQNFDNLLSSNNKNNNYNNNTNSNFDHSRRGSIAERKKLSFGGTSDTPPRLEKGSIKNLPLTRSLRLKSKTRSKSKSNSSFLNSPQRARLDQQQDETLLKRNLDFKNTLLQQQCSQSSLSSQSALESPERTPQRKNGQNSQNSDKMVGNVKNGQNAQNSNEKGTGSYRKQMETLARVERDEAMQAVETRLEPLEQEFNFFESKWEEINKSYEAEAQASRNELEKRQAERQAKNAKISNEMARIYKERQQRLEKEKKEREERVKREKIEKEKKARQERERLDRERKEKIAKDKQNELAQKRQKAEMEAKEAERKKKEKAKELANKLFANYDECEKEMKIRLQACKKLKQEMDKYVAENEAQWRELERKIRGWAASIGGSQKSVNKVTNMASKILDGLSNQSVHYRVILYDLAMKLLDVSDRDKEDRTFYGKMHFVHAMNSKYPQFLDIFLNVMVGEFKFYWMIPYADGRMKQMAFHQKQSMARCQLLGMPQLSPETLAKMAEEQQQGIMVFETDSKQKFYFNEAVWYSLEGHRMAMISALFWINSINNGSYSIHSGHAWKWLATMVNLPSALYPEVILFVGKFVKHCGWAMIQKYPRQFRKLLQVIEFQILPKVEVNSESGQTAVNAMKTLLLEYHKNQDNMQQPEFTKLRRALRQVTQADRIRLQENDKQKRPKYDV